MEGKNFDPLINTIDSSGRNLTIALLNKAGEYRTKIYKKFGF